MSEYSMSGKYEDCIKLNEIKKVFVENLYNCGSLLNS